MTTTTAVGRYPLRRETDGDFLLPPVTAPRQGSARAARPPAAVAEAALASRLWEPGQPDSDLTATAKPAAMAAHTTASDVELLCRVETSPIVRPSVAQHVGQFTPARGRAWLTLADHWIGVSADTGDLRFLNGACKLLGAACALDLAARWPADRLTDELSTTTVLLERASTALAARLAVRRLPRGGAHGAASRAPITNPPRRPVTVVLAGAGSASPARLLHSVRAAGADLDGICWYATPPGTTPPSSYLQAWYPPEPTAGRSVVEPLDVPETTAADWDQVVAILTTWRPALLVLLGMPIVPPAVLAIPSLGTINAHNGALPGYRGMDAVAWALLNDDPIVCSVHVVTANVDAGPVLVDRAVPFPPGPTLRARVKNTQLELLTRVIAHAALTGRLPGWTEQTGEARQFYRLHPHLKRTLDASPYGTGGPR